MTAPAELDVLIEQLDELLADGVEDASDAIEVAMVAGMADRLGADPQVLAEAVAWRDNAGGDLLDEVFAAVDWAELVEEIDSCTDNGAEPEEIEEALLEFDEHVVAAVWAKRRKDAIPFCNAVAKIFRQVPEAFADVADYGQDMAKLRAVGMDLDVYDYWLALADCAAYADV